MDIRTFQAKSIQEAIHLVRRELGPDAAVLHARELHTNPLGRLLFGRRYEIAASSAVNVPSRLRETDNARPSGHGVEGARVEETHPSGRAADAYSRAASAMPAEHATLEVDYAAKFRDDFRQQMAGQLDQLQSLVEKLCARSQSSPQHDLPEALFHVYTDLIEADIEENIARSLIERVSSDSDGKKIRDALLVKARVAQLLEREISVTGPISVSAGQRRVVALIGPTGVGKTTTIAKLAANFRLRERKRVGLITVDTYRVAAVEQLRTYADIIDLPMEVVATPREMREAVARLVDVDLVLMDTAGRSPRDEVKIQELKSMLTEAEPDEVHLVLSSTAGPKALLAAAERFACVGTTSLLLTKIDEATSLGHLISLIRECELPVSYLTDGQNVPDDIQIAQPRRLASMVMGIEKQAESAAPQRAAVA